MSSVLIVEDDLTIADLLQEALEDDGYTVTGIARTVEEAIQLAKQHDPDAAVVDIRLAKGGLGTQVGEYLRKSTKAKIIFSTGNSNDIATLAACGDAVMTKPYPLGDVSRGLRIIDELAQSGETRLVFPRNFRLLTPVEA